MSSRVLDDDRAVANEAFVLGAVGGVSLNSAVGPEAMKRSMSRQAEVERERRAWVISADGELQASAKLARAAGAIAATPGALQLRLETIVEVAAGKNSTLVLPFPVERLRFLESNTRAAAVPADSGPSAKSPAPAMATGQSLTGGPFESRGLCLRILRALARLAVPLKLSSRPL